MLHSVSLHSYNVLEIKKKKGGREQISGFQDLEIVCVCVYCEGTA